MTLIAWSDKPFGTLPKPGQGPKSAVVSVQPMLVLLLFWDAQGTDVLSQTLEVPPLCLGPEPYHMN